MVKEKLLELKENIKNQYDSSGNLSFFDFLCQKQYDIINLSGLFDKDFYYSNYPDVKSNGLDPIEHYINFGVLENCNPNINFNTKFYLDKYGDVKESNLNPFVHYILYGFFENRNSGGLKYFEDKYFISVIMPTFNRKNIIGTAIDSVLNQSFKNFELIIIDDGSEDKTDEFINEKYESYIKKGVIRYFNLNHVGVCSARNYGLKMSKGNYIAYLDSDNYWNVMYLEKMLKELDKQDRYNCAYCEVDVENRVENKKYVLSNEFDRKRLLKGNYIDINSFIHDRILFDTRGGFDENLTRLVDWDLIIRYTANNPPLFVKKALVNYFIDSSFENISLTESHDDNLELIRQKHWYELYEEEYKFISDIFDQTYYLTKYEDVLESGLNPIYHYLSIGYVEGRNPNSEFITSFYKYKYPQIVKNGVNPLVHYAKWGEQAGHQINNFEDYENIISTNSIFLSNYDFDKEPLVSIIILNKDGLEYLRNLFDDFSEKTNYSNFEIIVVDNNSSDGSVGFLKSLKDLNLTIIENEENVSFSKGNNDAVKLAKGEYILLLNNDIEPTFGWLNELMGTFIYNENVGAVGAKLVYPFIQDKKKEKYSFTIQHTGDIFIEENTPTVYKAYNLNKYSSDIFENSISYNKKCLSVTGAVLLTKKDIYLEIGGLDENFYYGYEDVDFNLRLYEKGYDVIFASAALLFHNEMSTPRESNSADNYKILYDKWNEFLFRELLFDKIEKNGLFTEKKLKFLIIFNQNFEDNLKEKILDLNNYFNMNDYNSITKCDLLNNEIDEETDILISFSQNYNIKDCTGRKNLIKVLILNEFSKLSSSIELDNWDLIIAENGNIKKDIENLPIFVPIYNIENSANLGEEIISILYKNFKI